MIKNILLNIVKFPRLVSFFGEEYTVICKIDNIGDYILFRNFLRDFRKSKINGGRKVLLIGNKDWKNIFEIYDSESVDKIFWVNTGYLQRSRIYRIFVLFLLNCYRIHTIIQPTYSRNQIIDFLLLPLRASFKFSPNGDDLNHDPESKILNDNKYTNLIEIKKELEFEFDRNLYFFEQLDPIFSNVKFSLPYQSFKREKEIIAFFVGSSSKSRQLSISKLTFMFKTISQNSRYKIIVLGGRSEARIGEFLSKISDNIESQCGKLSLTETINIIGNSKVTITMDSSGLHMAMGTGVKSVFCFSNGNHIFRFVPYPKKYSNLTVFFPPLIEKLIKTEKKLLYDSFSRGSLLSIDSIDSNLALKKIVKVLDSL
ncbi:glycosyltransferase family 9 protein [Leptospira kanakyensis]|nr:glycosyltransferase family 9 protein [Leptospira kanakyensis]MCW7482106.1 hypothetical protein [Leptospira kanakyensis]